MNDIVWNDNEPFEGQQTVEVVAFINVDDIDFREVAEL